MLKAKSGPVNKSPKLQLDFRKEKDDLDMEVGSFYGECFWDNVIINGAFAGGVSWTLMDDLTGDMWWWITIIKLGSSY